MTDLARFAAGTSRRLRLAALTLIALFAVKVVAVSLTADPRTSSASAPIRSAAAGETLERME